MRRFLFGLLLALSLEARSETQSLVQVFDRLNVSLAHEGAVHFQSVMLKSFPFIADVTLYA